MPADRGGGGGAVCLPSLMPCRAGDDSGRRRPGPGPPGGGDSWQSAAVRARTVAPCWPGGECGPARRSGGAGVNSTGRRRARSESNLGTGPPTVDSGPMRRHVGCISPAAAAAVAAGWLRVKVTVAASGGSELLRLPFSASTNAAAAGPFPGPESGRVPGLSRPVTARPCPGWPGCRLRAGSYLKPQAEGPVSPTHDCGSARRGVGRTRSASLLP